MYLWAFLFHPKICNCSVSNAIWAISAASHGRVLLGWAIQSASCVSSYV
jgi:hypothetical protein